MAWPQTNPKQINIAPSKDVVTNIKYSDPWTMERSSDVADIANAGISSAHWVKGSDYYHERAEIKGIKFSKDDEEKYAELMAELKKSNEDKDFDLWLCPKNNQQILVTISEAKPPSDMLGKGKDFDWKCLLSFVANTPDATTTNDVVWKILHEYAQKPLTRKRYSIDIWPKFLRLGCFRHHGAHKKLQKRGSK
ncbi:uncharacterized protein FOMMEDRAFT_26991 [Fomitiporia mediterranea MF3/22]|uniref:uncharacterized protein n=1 Tax=Fomitiporia mediterranea (strain MF3/22) TaxID=694068 RepID=UPI0004407321|nr:uncharacterized protein FOMMEDRAFT_26991 [Fomitiporia mediterranea MF3/22]EJD06274.1 hypothetical protein FOMMEDRAFT_26991 [Fomitiporia mediterranea MF3/22]